MEPGRPTMHEMLVQARKLSMQVASTKAQMTRQQAELQSVEARYDELNHLIGAVSPASETVKEERAKCRDKRRILLASITENQALLFPLEADLASVERELRYNMMAHQTLVQMQIDDQQLSLALDVEDQA